VAAIREQLDRVAHTSFLGFTHPGAAELAARLCALFPGGEMERVFFSDDGSTAVECALKMAVQYRLQTGEPERRTFAAFANGYHGDTLGAASLGGVGRFFERFRGCGYEVCHVSSLDDLAAMDAETVARIAGVVIEPLIQGVNEMRPWPAGMLAELRAWCDRHGAHLILDEVMTGFGRTGAMFACQRENVTPDFLCVAKGLTGGYSPMAATMTTGAVYQAFLGDAERAFYYGHSYTAHPPGCAAALASLEVFAEERTLARLPERIDHLRSGLAALQARHAVVHEVRQCGLIAGIELRKTDGTRFDPASRTGEAVCVAARAHGLLTRPVLDTIVLMPPLCATAGELDHALGALDRALEGIRNC
jgi:adenosylmethionine-8-amino-7-oxononanoate aminotransferase